MCYAVQRVGYSVDGIGRTFKQLFPATYELYKTERERQEKLKEQEEVRDRKADEALNLQEYILDKKQNQDLDDDIDEILIRSKTVVGIKGAIQLQTQLISLLLNENRKLDALLAASLRSRTMREKNDIAKERIMAEERQAFLKNWGATTTEKKVLKDFP
jgi:P-type conjugative transfer protein TrbJ